MTKTRKIGISLAFALILVLTCAIVVPLYSVNNANVASAAAPVITDTASTWENTYNGAYYNNLNEDLRGTAFRSELASLITSTHKHQTSYDELKTVYKTSDADPNKSGNIIWFYTGTSHSYNGSLGSSANDTNREHVWAKTGGTTFDPQSGPGSDAHHLRPTEALLNNARSNYGFGIVSQTDKNVVAEGNSKSYGSAPDGLCYLSGGLFYPAKGYRGATARILFYMQVRWGDQFSLDFVDGKTTNNGKNIGKISDLFRWHLEEPPTDQEIRRNEVVFGIQGNRNPFIDHPEYAEMIYCNSNASYSNKLKSVLNEVGGYLDNSNGGGGDVTPDPTLTSISLSVDSLNLTVGQSSSKINVTANPSTASNSVTWSTSNSSVATVNNGVVMAVGAGSATITATSTVNTNIKATVAVKVNALPIDLESITITPGAVSLAQGGVRRLSVTASPAGADNSVTWSSSNSNVVTVSQEGLLSAVNVGTATITATSVENPSIQASITVTVISQAANTQQFLDNLNAIENATTLQDRYDAIKRAIDAYNQMTDYEQTTQRINGNYAKLEEAIDAYNNEIQAINDEFSSANSVAIGLMTGGVSVSFVALVVLVIKRLIGR